ncbi:MAG: sensor histidine kinase [Flavobacteriales bacterium]
MTRRPRAPVVLFGLLVLYMLLQSAWWMWLLLSKDRDILALQSQLAAAGLVPVLPVRQPQHARMMVLGEGLVFLLLLLAGLWATFRTVRHDLQLARQQQDFILAVSHELRTPIAGLKLHLQTLERSGLQEDQRKQLSRHAREDVERLNGLSERILQASRLENRSEPVVFAPVDLAALARFLVKEAALTHGTGHELALDVPAELAARTDADAFRTVLGNLLENSCKYAPQGTNVQVAVERVPSGVKLRVSDEGPGIQPRDQERMYEKFFRGGNESTRTAKGVGLGLFIVQRTMEEIGGTLKYRHTEPHGATFEAVFPDQA